MGVSEIGCLTSHATIFQLYMWRHRCAGGLKKLYLPSGSQRHRHSVGFFNVPVLHRHGTTLFIRLFRETTPFSRLLRHDWNTGDVFSTLTPHPTSSRGELSMVLGAGPYVEHLQSTCTYLLKCVEWCVDGDCNDQRENDQDENTLQTTGNDGDCHGQKVNGHHGQDENTLMTRGNDGDCHGKKVNGHHGQDENTLMTRGNDGDCHGKKVNGHHGEDEDTHHSTGIKKLLLSGINHFKSDLFNNMRISGNEPSSVIISRKKVV